jgi:hypothetical protein
MAKVGRPTDYTDELGDKICAQLVEGKSLVKICQVKSMPCTQSVYRWLRTHPEFCDNYARAKQDRAEYQTEEIIDIADDQSIDPQHKRIMVDTRKWHASKMMPKVYGDLKQIEHSGEIGLKSIPDDQLDDELESLLNQED